MPAVAEKPRLKRQPRQSYIVATLGEVADFFGASITTVAQWRCDGDPMPGAPGAFDLSAIAQWKLRKNRGGSSGGLSDDLKAAEIRLKTAQAQQKELDYAVQRGELVELPAVELWAATALIECREMMMQFPEMVATSTPPEIREFARSEAERHVRATLIALRRRLESAAIEGDEVLGTAPEGDVG